jgi:hypothetical protein
MSAISLTTGALPGPGVPFTLTREIEESRRRILETIGSPIDLTLITGAGNHGDQLILEGTRSLLSNVRYREIRWDEVEGAAGDTAVIRGSGGWCLPFHKRSPRTARLAAERFRRVIVLPSTFDPEEPSVREALSLPGITWFARERESLRLISGLCDARLALDAAFFFDFKPYLRPGNGTLNAFRTDQESRNAFDLPADNVDVSVACRSLEEWLKMIAAHELVRTDRAHVMIAAAMLGKRVEFWPTNYHKVGAIAEYALGEFPVKLQTDPPAPGIAAHHVFLEAPEVSGDTVSWRWSIAPRPELYAVDGFWMRFPECVDLSRVPTSLLWIAGLIALHSQWITLSPCRVYLPVRLRSRHREVLVRLLETQMKTYEAYCREGSPKCAVEIFDSGPQLEPVPPLPETGRYATTFSGGKDGLLQTAMLCEWTENPVLVSVTSPLPPLEDHETSRRRYVFHEIGRRRRVTHVEVNTNLRTIWDNGFPARRGYRSGVSTMSDTLLYAAALSITGYAMGVTHLLQASEAEVQENAEIDGRIIQHPHAMYSVPTLSGVQELLRDGGMRLTSLTSPLRSNRVQQLLWLRYPELADLQYSCWRVGKDENTCSRCVDCLRVAFCTLSLGYDPAAMGIDLPRLLAAMAAWVPPERNGPTPRDRVSKLMYAMTARMIADTRPAVVAASLRRAGGFPVRPFVQFLLLRRRMRALDPGPLPGYRGGYLQFADESLRDRVAKVYAATFHEEPLDDYRDNLERTLALVRYIVRGNDEGGEAGS